MKTLTKPAPDKPFAAAIGSAQEALASPELSFLNHNHSFPLKEDARPGLLGRFRVRLRNFILGDYLQRESEYQAQLGRHLNAIQDRLKVALLRLEAQGLGSAYTAERTLMDRLAQVSAQSNQMLGTLQSTSAAQELKLETLDSVTHGLERILSQLSKPAAQPVGNEAAPASIDYSYLLLENRYRGNETEISSRLSIYPQVFTGAAKPVLEIGAGRGELQKLFREAGVPSYGVEQDAAMVERCAEQGLDVRSGDAIAHLEKLEDASLGGIIAVQVVEHLPYPVLTRLFELAARKVAPGGTVVFETIYSGSVVALTQNYFRDPTHQAPLHPDTMRHLLETSGLAVREIRKLSPFPEGAMLQEIPRADYMTPRWNETLDVLNRNIRRLNDLLYGHQDYCVIAESPARK